MLTAPDLHISKENCSDCSEKLCLQLLLILLIGMSFILLIGMSFILLIGMSFILLISMSSAHGEEVWSG